MEFITTGNRIAVENFDIGKIYTITWETGNYKSLACTGKGTDFVMFQDQEPDLLFCLTMDSAISVSSIEEGGGGSGTMNYNELENKPSINGFVLVGNKTGADLGLASQSDLEDYATNASVVAGLATKQDALSSSQIAAVNSGITSALVTQIGTNTSAIAGKQDTLSSSQLAAVNSGITSALVTQIGTNTSALAGKQDALSSSQLAAVNSGITSTDVAQITTNKNNILTLTPTLSGGVCNVTSDYSCISELTQNIPFSEGENPAPIARISAMIAGGTIGIRGIILSLSNDSTTYDNNSNLLARTEQQSAIQAALSVSTLFFNANDNTNVPIYVWLKGSGSGNVRAYSTLEYLRR